MRLRGRPGYSQGARFMIRDDHRDTGRLVPTRQDDLDTSPPAVPPPAAGVLDA